MKQNNDVEDNINQNNNDRHTIRKKEKKGHGHTSEQYIQKSRRLQGEGGRKGFVFDLPEVLQKPPFSLVKSYLCMMFE